jgi:hypothetical protein
MVNDLFISNVPVNLLKRLKNRLENIKATGRQRGDLKRFVVEAITEKLDGKGENNT